MRNLRKLLVVTMIVTMVAGFAGMAAATTVAARPFTDAVGHEFEKELTAMRALGIMLGDAGTTLVRPDAPITRAEMAVIITRMLGRDRLAGALGAFQPAFADAVPTWAWGAVNVVSNMGIVRGFPDGTFGATRNVTHAEALAMLIRATGHEPGAVGVWPLNFMMAGFDLGISGRVEAFANLPSSRAEIAHFVYNALDIRRGIGTGADYVATGTKILWDNAGTTPVVPHRRQWIGRAGTFSATARTLAIDPAATLSLADSVHLWGFASFTDLFNAQIRAVADPAGRVVFIEPAAAVNVVRRQFKSLDTATNEIVFKDDSRIRYDDTAGDTPVTSVSLNRGTSAALEGGGVTLVADDWLNVTLRADGVAEFVDAFRVNVANGILTAVTAATATVPARITVAGVSHDVDPVTTTITLNGARVAVGDLRANDVLYVATLGAGATAAAISIEAVRTTVVGTVTGLRTITTLVAGAPTTHKMVDLRLADGTTRSLRLDGPADPATGSVMTYGLNKDGFARVAIGVTFATSYVRLIGWEAGVVPARATFDVAGAAVTHAVYAEANFTNADIGRAGKLVINPATGLAEHVRFFPAIGAMLKGRIFSIDAAANIVTVEVYGGTAWTNTFVVSTRFVTAYVATTGDAAIGAHAPLTGLAVGDRVYYVVADGWSTDPKATLCMEPGDVGRVIFILRRATRTLEW